MTASTPLTEVRFDARAFRALFLYTLRSGVPPKRRLVLLVPVVAAVLFGLLATTLDESASENFADVALLGLFALVLPVTCLVVGDAVLGAEIRRGAFTFTWMSPVPTWVIVVARWLAGTVLAGACMAASFALSAVIAGTSDSAGPAAIAGAFGAAAYIAVFMAIGCVAQRAAVWSLAFVFLVERLLGAALSGIAQLSPSWVARGAFLEYADGPSDLVRSGVPTGTAALIRLVFLMFAGLAVATWRLPHLKGGGASD
jgi:hypothetical protein